MITNDIQRSRYNHATKGGKARTEVTEYLAGIVGERVGVGEASRFASGGALLATPVGMEVRGGEMRGSSDFALRHS